MTFKIGILKNSAIFTGKQFLFNKVEQLFLYNTSGDCFTIISNSVINLAQP